MIASAGCGLFSFSPALLSVLRPIVTRALDLHPSITRRRSEFDRGHLDIVSTQLEPRYVLIPDKLPPPHQSFSAGGKLWLLSLRSKPFPVDRVDLAATIGSA